MLLLTMHHIVTDGWSMGILMRELAGMYRAYSQGEKVAFDGVAGAICGLRGVAAGVAAGRSAGTTGYWRAAAGGASGVLELPADGDGRRCRAIAGARYGFSCRREQQRGLKGTEPARRMRRCS